MSSFSEQLDFCLPHQFLQDFCLRFWWFPIWHWQGEGGECHKSASSYQHWHPCDSLRFGNPPAIRRRIPHEILKCLLTACTALPCKIKVPSLFISQYLSKEHIRGRIEWHYWAHTRLHLGYLFQVPPVETDMGQTEFLQSHLLKES